MAKSPSRRSSKTSGRGPAAGKPPAPRRREEAGQQDVIDVPAKQVRDAEEDGEDDGQVAASGAAPSASNATPGDASLLDQFGEALLKMGSEARRLGKLGVAHAEKYGKLGWCKAEVEKEKLALQYAYSRLGEKVVKLWDDSPLASVRAGDQEISGEVGKIKTTRERIAKLREEMNELRAKDPSQKV